MAGGPSGGATFSAALLYFIKAFVGPGCLSLPLAFQNAGLGLGLFTLLLLAVGVTHNLRTLILCKRHYVGLSTYPEVAEAAGGVQFRRTVEVLMHLVQLGVCTVYFDFFGENVQALLPRGAVGSRALMVVVFPVYFGLSLLKDVKTIAPFAALANALIFFAIAVVLFAAAAELERSGEPRYAVARPQTLPLFFGTVVYSFEGVNSMLPVENALKERDDVFPVLYYGMGVVTLAYASVGAFCYVAWPDAGREQRDSTSLQIEFFRSNFRKESTHASRSPRGMIARPKMSQIEWKTIEIRGFKKVGNVLTPGPT